MLVRDMRNQLGHFTGVAFGHTRLMHDPAAHVVEFTCPEAVTSLPDHWDQLIILSQRKGVLVTSTPKATWERTLTNQATAQQAARITRLTWRRSTRGGRAWVIPQAINQHASSQLREDWSGMTGPSRCTIHIQVKGDAGTDPNRIMHQLLQKLTQCSGIQWSAAAAGEIPRPGQLAPVSGQGGGWDGGFVAETSNPEQTQAVARMLNGLCFAGAAGAHWLNVELQHDHGHRSARGRQGNEGRRR